MDHQTTVVFSDSFFLYKLMTWQLRPLVQYLTIALIHAFFYLYIWRGISVISTISLAALFLFFWRMVKPSSTCQEECLTEETAKKLYVALYVGLNKFVQYMRTAILAKNGMLDVGVSSSSTFVSHINFLESSCFSVRKPDR